jgi:phosphatidylserine/phosphatidylglycerophosphate/cardiolipin synthase-like enzyme
LEQQLELVWTGPNPERSGLRRIDQVLLSMLREARESILLVTYASYKVPVIREALWDAVERGVSLRLVVESHEKEDGARGLDPTRAYGKELVERADVLVWPLVNRERDENNRFGVLHVKSAVVDGAQMLLSSANLTGSAMTMNMELGLLIKGGELPGRVEAHITSLVRHGVLEAWPSEA